MITEIKKYSLFLLLFLSGAVFSQAPPKINYQGLARDAAGIPITSLTTIGVEFKISDGTNALVHSEVQSSVPISTLGLFNTKIGATSAISNTITWQNGPYTLSVSVNVGTGFNFLGAQQLVSVPYALYAERSGSGSLPQGTKAGQTMRWDGLVWKVDSNLTNDGSHVGIGLYPAGLQSRLHVTTNSPNDTTVIFAYHPNMQAKGAGLRSVIAGSTPSNTNPFATAVYAGHHVGINNGAGLGVGNFAMGISNGNGIGATALGYGTSATSTATGLYATAIGHPLANKIAAVFDVGKVIFSDTLFIIGTNTLGGVIPGDVLTYMPNGQAKWQPVGAGSSCWLQGVGLIKQINNTDYVGIGVTNPIAKVEISNPAANTVDALRITDNGSSDALHVFKLGPTGPGIDLYMANGNNGAGISLSHLGTGPGIMSSVGPATALQGNSNGNSPTIFAGNGGTGAGVYGSSTGGIGVLGTANNMTTAVVGVNQNSANPSPTSHGGYFLTNNSHSLAAGSFGESKGTGAGVIGLNSNASLGGIGVYGTVSNTTNANASGVKGENAGFGTGITGYNSGPGAAIKAQSGPANNSALALLVDQGHVRATGPLVTVPSVSIAGGFVLVGNSCPGCNDVRGTTNFNIGASTLIGGPNYIETNIQFAKPYTNPPFINLTSTTDLQGLDYMVTNVTVTGFTIRIYRPTGAGFPTNVGAATFSITYFIIE
jgi:hypothetical protein